MAVSRLQPADLLTSLAGCAPTTLANASAHGTLTHSRQENEPNGDLIPLTTCPSSSSLLSSPLPLFFSFSVNLGTGSGEEEAEEHVLRGASPVRDAEPEMRSSGVYPCKEGLGHPWPPGVLQPLCSVSPDTKRNGSHHSDWLPQLPSQPQAQTGLLKVMTFLRPNPGAPTPKCSSPYSTLHLSRSQGFRNV